MRVPAPELNGSSSSTELRRSVNSDGFDESEITVTHDSATHCVRISGAHENSIDTSPVSETIDGDVEWRSSGRYLVLSFPL